MKRVILVIEALVVFAISHSAYAFVKPLLVNLDDLPKTERWAVKESDEQHRIFKKIKDPLEKAAISEAVEDWESCVLNAKSVSQKSPVKEWAAYLQLSCAIHLTESEVKPKGKANPGILLADGLREMEKYNSDSVNKSFQEKRKAAIVAGRLVLCRYLQKRARWKELKLQLQKAFLNESGYSKSERAELYEFAGEVFVAERQWGEAFNQFQRSRAISSDGNQVESRIKAILPMLPVSVREQVEATIKTGPAPIPAPAMPSTEEQDLLGQADNYLIQHDSVSAVDALAKMIHKYPGGIKSKWAQDKIYELLNSEIEKSKGPNGPSVAKKKILNVMLNFDADRQMEWGKALFDSQMYGDAAPLLKSAASQIAGSARASRPYYLAGRAFQLTGDYSRAKECYQIILRNFAASPELVDASIQWALININEGEPSESIAHLEVARSKHMTNQQDLISLFWLYESYKMKNTHPGLENASDELVKKFGLTYYGIIAYQEAKKSLPQFAKVKNKPAKVFLSSQESLILERVRALLSSGLMDEANEELSYFFTRNLNQDEEQFLVNYFSQGMQYQKVFSLLTNLFDEAPEKKTDQLARKLFPKEFWEVVSDNKVRSEVDPYLLLAVMKQESAFDKNAMSHSGAVGLMQMIPPTAEEVKKELGADVDLPDDLSDPAVNIRFCAYYLAKLIKKYNGSVPLALAAYNAGPSRVTLFMNAKTGGLRDTWVDELPWAETSFYVKSILKNYVMYRVLYGGLTQLPVPPWLNH